MQNPLRYPHMRAQYGASFYSPEELKLLGFKSLGEDILLSRQARIYAAHRIELGDCVRIDDFAILSGAIRLGSFIHISSHASIMGGDGITSSVTMGDFSSLSLGGRILSSSDDLSSGVLVNSCVEAAYRGVKGSHIGALSIVLPNTTFEEGANLGPNSLVGDMVLKGFGYYFSSPARLIKTLDRDRVLELEARFLDELKTR